MGDDPEQLAIELTDMTFCRAGQFHRIGDHRVQHRLNIGRRAGDDTQDFARRRLLFQCLFEFLEQPHVLDSNHGLVGKSFEEFDLRWGERRQLYSTGSEVSYNFRPLAKRNKQRCTPVTTEILQRNFGLLLNIRNVQSPVLAHPVEKGLINTDLNASYWNRTEMGTLNHSVALAESQNNVINPANPRGALDDGVEDRLHIRGRAAYDAEHLGGCSLMLQCFAQF